MDNYRQLLQELMDAIDSGIPVDRIRNSPLAVRIDAALDQPAPPAEGEVAGLVEFLRVYGDEVMDEYGDVGEHDMLTRAADLLEQYQAAPVPAEAEVEKAPAVTEVIAWLRTEAEIDDGFELTQSAAYQRRAADLLERQAAPVVEGEIAELVRQLGSMAADAEAADFVSDAAVLNRAIKYLERRVSPVPVPVCERDLDSILSPSGGYELREGAALTEGAQLIGGEWWAPVFGCDSVESALNRIRQRLDPFQQNGKLKNYQAFPPLPIPVSERLPGPKDCDAEHYCWRWNTIGRLWARQPLARSWYEFESHWLPAAALLLPAEERE